MKTKYPNRENCSAEELESFIKRAKTPLEQKRLLSIQMFWSGMKAKDISAILCVSDVSVYNWVARFNHKGVDGLLTRERGGRPRLVKAEEFAKLLNVFEEPQKVGELHWTAKKFHAHLKEELKIKCGYSTLLNYLNKADYRLKYGRSWPQAPEKDEESRMAFKVELSRVLADDDTEVWYSDEAGFDGDPRPRRGWSKKGERKKIFRTQKHLRMSAIGMICPKTGEFFALEIPYTDRDAFQAFLDTANVEIKSTKKNQVLILDNASWHKSAKINWGRFFPLYLPPYSPDLNPIERIWSYLKQTFFNSFTAQNLEELIRQLDVALLSLFNKPDLAASITSCELT